MTSRRTVLASLASMGAAGLARGALAQAGGDYVDFASPDLPDYTLLGTQPALQSEVTRALALLAAPACPTTSPINAMQYLSSLKDANADGELYNAGWRTRWNPVIVEFFKSTGTRPSGDLTPWCAAGLNWVLGHCGVQGTGSASSATFRTAPGRTDAPVRGDVVCFRRTDPAEAALGHGHVALFVSQDANSVLCLGCNQIRNGHHQVSQQNIQKNGFLTLDSFHSLSAFPRKP